MRQFNLKTCLGKVNIESFKFSLYSIRPHQNGGKCLQPDCIIPIFKMATDYLPRESAFEIPTLALVKNTSYYFTEKTGHCINGSLSLHQINYKCKVRLQNKSARLWQKFTRQPPSKYLLVITNSYSIHCASFYNFLQNLSILQLLAERLMANCQRKKKQNISTHLQMKNYGREISFIIYIL